MSSIISAVLLLLSTTITATVDYSTPQKVSAQVIEAPAVDPLSKDALQAKATEVASNYGIATSTLFNLVTYESRWNPFATSTTGDYGLVQINLKAHPNVTLEQAQDPDFALNFAAKAISQGNEDQWVVCNCYLYAQVKLHHKLPRMASIVPNSTPGIGKLAIFNYHGVKHLSVITKLEADGFWVDDANFTKCALKSHFIAWDDPALVGFGDY